MKKTRIILPLFAALFAVACNNDRPSQKIAEIASSPEQLAEGFSILDNNCFSCHSPQRGEERKVAPPIFAVKKHYNEAESKADFVASFTKFVLNPSEETAKMKPAIEKFGLMPKMNFTAQQLEAVAAYLYQADIENKDWFEKQYPSEKEKYASITAKKILSPTEQGLQYAMKTKSVLGKNLLGAIKENGTVAALSFCNAKAYRLTDSIANQLNISIKRVSDQTRNPLNAANQEELAYIIAAKKTIEEGGKVSPQMQEIEGKNIGYYPIMTNKMCLQCHGQINSEIKAKTLSKIKKFYPNDEATGYQAKQLRGIWVVEF